MVAARYRPRHRDICVFIVGAALAACVDNPSTGGWSTTVDTLPNGAIAISHTPPPADGGSEWRLKEELRIGNVDGNGPATFGELKALAVDARGRIIVLESQAREIRIFSRDATHLVTYGGRGGGPGEFENPLGIMQAGNGLLYVPDQRNARMSVLSVDSGFIRSYPFRMYRYGFVWHGVMRKDDHILVPSLSPETRRDITRIYSLDLTEVDSVLMPNAPAVDRAEPPDAFAWRSADGRVRGFSPIPFYAEDAAFLDRTGHRWSATSGDPAYRIARTTLAGDTVLVLMTRRDQLPVSPAERDSAMKELHDQLSRYGVSGLDASRVPATKPSVLDMFMDEQDRLWVRVTSTDSMTRYDIYEQNGRHVRSVATDLDMLFYIKPVVRGDTVWAVVTDNLDVPYVVRARIQRHSAPS